MLVSGAAGGVGNVVGQLAKIRGCTVIGLVGNDKKAHWCWNELHFDHVFNYKKVNFSDAISQVAPNGVDIYFDNVGEDIFLTVLNRHMNNFGRIMTVGSIQTYNEPETEPKKCKPYYILFYIFNKISIIIFKSYSYSIR